MSLPCSLYIHVPWCVRKCPYCDFNSHESTTFDEAGYIDTLIADLEQELDTLPAPAWHSIFIGGGTPSLFSADGYARLLNAVNDQVAIGAGTEITLEANPGTAEANRFKGYRNAGINRLSLGFQSLSDQSLERLGRIHDANEALAAFAMARDAGFDNINVDLMYGLPDQSTAAAMQDLETAMALGPEHLSWYQLTIEPNTRFYRYPPLLPDHDSTWTIHEQGEQRLVASGYAQYEVSAWAQPGRQCRHNLNYWQFGDYVGIGAGAHGKRRSGNTTTRTQRTRHPAHYLVSTGRQQKAVAEEELPLEFLMNALRLNAGFTLDQFSAATGLQAERLNKFVSDGKHQQLLETEGNTLRASEQGRRYLDSLLVLA